jgi:uncharacterized protein
LWDNRRDRKILFHGGEPLLAGHEWFEYALRAFTRELEHRVQFSVQSNLWLLDQRFADLFARYQVNVGTSLDGDRDASIKNIQTASLEIVSRNMMEC